MQTFLRKILGGPREEFLKHMHSKWRKLNYYYTQCGKMKHLFSPKQNILSSNQFFAKDVGFTKFLPKNALVIFCNYHTTVWKLWKFSLTHFRQKFRETNGFTKEITKWLTKFFSARRERISRFSTLSSRHSDFAEFIFPLSEMIYLKHIFFISRTLELQRILQCIYTWWSHQFSRHPESMKMWIYVNFVYSFC